MRKGAFLLALAALAACAACAACASRGVDEDISEERAIELARRHVEFEPGKVEAVKDMDQDRPVWRVTFYGKGVSAAHPGEVMLVVLDRKTGELVSLGMS